MPLHPCVRRHVLRLVKVRVAQRRHAPGTRVERQPRESLTPGPAEEARLTLWTVLTLSTAPVAMHRSILRHGGRTSRSLSWATGGEGTRPSVPANSMPARLC